MHESTASQSDDGDEIIGGRKRKVRKNVAKPNHEMLVQIIEMIDRIEDRLIRLETKMDDINDDIATLSVRNLRTRAGKY